MYQSLRTAHKSNTRCSFFIIAFSVFAFVCMIIVLVVLLHDFESPGHLTLVTTHLSVSTKARIVTFQDNHDYRNLSHDKDLLWDALIPPNGGFIVKFDEQNKRHGYGVSMFHQLHCLSILRSSFQLLQDKEVKSSSARLPPAGCTHNAQYQYKGLHSKQETHAETIDDEHWTHCFDYLRQVRRLDVDLIYEFVSNSISRLYYAVLMHRLNCQKWIKKDMNSWTAWIRALVETGLNYGMKSLSRIRTSSWLRNIFQRSPDKSTEEIHMDVLLI